MTTDEKDIINAMSNIDMKKLVKNIDEAYNERNENADNLLGELLDVQDSMNDWESNFVDSLVDWRSEPDKKSIKFNQYETVLKLYQKYCDATG